MLTGKNSLSLTGIEHTQWHCYAPSNDSGKEERATAQGHTVVGENRRIAPITEMPQSAMPCTQVLIDTQTNVHKFTNNREGGQQAKG